MKDSELRCSACVETALAMHKAVLEADASGKTIEVGHRKEGSHAARKSIKYSRSDLHMADMLEQLCKSAHLGADAYDAVGKHKEMQQWHFLNAAVSNATREASYAQTLTGAHVAKKLSAMCSHFLEEHEDTIASYLKEKGSNGELIPLPAKPLEFMMQICYRETKQCKAPAAAAATKSAPAAAADSKQAKQEL